MPGEAARAELLLPEAGGPGPRTGEAAPRSPYIPCTPFRELPGPRSTPLFLLLNPSPTTEKPHNGALAGPRGSLRGLCRIPASIVCARADPAGRACSAAAYPGRSGRRV